MGPDYWIRAPFSALSHLFGAVLGAAGLVILTEIAQSPRELVTAVVYGLSLIAVFLASALTHTFGCATPAGKRCEQFDRAAIFLLIAGTYTPLCMLVLPGTVGVTVLLIEWLLALVGVWTVFTGRRVSKRRQVAVYLAMGWLFLPTLGIIASRVSGELLLWLLAGVILYSVGAAVYLRDKPRRFLSYFSAHDLWHLFVLGGSACHFVMVAGMVGR